MTDLGKSTGKSSKIQIGRMPASKRTWPIKGRGLGVIRQGAMVDLIRRMQKGYRPSISTSKSGLVTVTTDYGWSFGRSEREWSSLLEEAGIEL